MLVGSVSCFVAPKSECNELKKRITFKQKEETLGEEENFDSNCFGNEFIYTPSAATGDGRCLGESRRVTVKYFGTYRA